MKNVCLKIKENKPLNSHDVYRMILEGDTSEIKGPGQFINIRIDGLFLRRPISVCDYDESTLTIIYKVIGEGTRAMSMMNDGEELDVLMGLGNGYDTSLVKNSALLIGGGVGVPPLYNLAKKLLRENKKVTAVLGFNNVDDVFYENEFKKLNIETIITTVDGSYGNKGFVTDYLPEDYDHFFTCGPEPMLKAVYSKTKTNGQFSFEERMGCGFGACMGCTCKTISGYKRICKDGPVLMKEDILWEK